MAYYYHRENGRAIEVLEIIKLHAIVKMTHDGYKKRIDLKTFRANYKECEPDATLRMRFIYYFDKDTKQLKKVHCSLFDTSHVKTIVKHSGLIRYTTHDTDLESVTKDIFK